MPFSSGQIIFPKARRIFEFLTFAFFILIIYIAFSEWTSTFDNPIEENEIVLDYSDLPTEEFSNKEITGRPNLAKYIHLDLKGAPPKATQFYESFFASLAALQMGIEGVLIEYEDTLPLEGNLINVSTNNRFNS
jgi:hypothetical protein